jgi:ribosomal protein L29
MADETKAASSQEEDAVKAEDTTAQEADSKASGENAEVDSLKAEISRLRKEAAKSRTEKQSEKSQVDSLKKAIAQALGMEKDDVNPEQLAKDLAATRQQLRRERVGNAFMQVASKLDADAELTMAYMAHKGMLDDLDPDSEDFRDDLESKVKAAVKGNDKLKITPLPGKSGTEHAGGSKSAPDMNAWLRKAAGIG